MAPNRIIIREVGTNNKEGGIIRKGVGTSVKNAQNGGLSIVGGSMVNRQCRNPNISKLLHLVGTLCKYKENSLF